MLERLTTLEARFEENRQQLAHISAALDRLSGDVQTARRPQWQLYLTAVGVMLSMVTGAVAVLGFVGMAMIRPIEQSVSANTQGIATNREHIITLASRAEENAAGIIRDRGRIEEMDRLMRIVYPKATGEELPPR